MSTENDYLEDIRVGSNVEDSKYENLSIENVFKEFSLSRFREIATQKKVDVRVPKRYEKRQETDKIRQCYMDELVKKCRDHGIKQMILEVPKFLMVMLTKNFWM